MENAMENDMETVGYLGFRAWGWVRLRVLGLTLRDYGY